MLPLVAGLFVLTEALDRTGAIRLLADELSRSAAQSVLITSWGAGTAIAFLCNLTNNLPAGLIAGTALQGGDVPSAVTGAVMIGVDLGPNLSITGSLATILWLTALRRDGYDIGAGSFLKLGMVVMPPALALALGGLLLVG